MRTLILALVLATPLPALAADPPARLDLYGDPLPQGAIMRLGTVRNRAPITGLGIQKDGTVVTIGYGADVRRWHVHANKSDEAIVIPLPDTNTYYHHPRVSPDGTLIAVYSANKVRVLETPTDAKPKEIASFTIKQPRLPRFSPDGSKLVVLSLMGQNSTMHLCDIKSGKVTDFDGTLPFAYVISFSGDGKRVAAASLEHLFVWDATTGAMLAQHDIKGRSNHALALDQTGRVMASASTVAPYPVEFLDVITLKPVDGFKGPPNSWVTLLTYAPDGKSLLISDQNGIRWWDHVAGKLIRKFEHFNAGVVISRTTQFTPDGKTLVSNSNAVLFRWNAATGKQLFPEQSDGHCDYLNAVGASADGKLYATRSADYRVNVWDAATGKQLWHTTEFGSLSQLQEFSPDSKYLYVIGPEGMGQVTKYDALTGKEILKFAVDPKETQRPLVSCFRLSTDGKTAHGFTQSYSADFPLLRTTWDTSSGERKKTTRLDADERRFRSRADISPGGDFIATDFGRAVAVNDPEKNLLEASRINNRYVGEFSHDGKWLTIIGLSEDNGETIYQAHVISTATWRVGFSAPMAAEGKAALSPDAKTLAIAVGDVLEFHDIETSKLIAKYSLPLNTWKDRSNVFMRVLRFTPDGSKLITGNLDTTALVWTVPKPAK